MNRRSLLSKRDRPKLLKESAGGRSCCIFRISHPLRRINSSAYVPDLVSIGPYHHGKKQLQMIEEHKIRFLHLFVKEAEKNCVTFEKLAEAVSEREEAIRSCYSENLVDLDSEKLIDMMLLDCSFILMLFFIISRKVESTGKEDPIFCMPWILSTIRSDLLLLENQVPLFLLEALFVTSKISPAGGLNKMALKFFRYSTQLQKISLPSHYNIEAKHLLDLIRQTFIPHHHHLPDKDKLPNHTSLSIPCWKSETETWESDSDPSLRMITSAKRLCKKGLVLKPRPKANSWLDIQFKNGVLEIPPFDLDDFIGQVLLNFVAFEQFYGYCSNHVTSYVAFMGCLMSDKADAKFLTENGIMEVFFETNQQASQFFTNIGKDVAFDISTSYLAQVFQGVNNHTSRPCLVRFKELRHTFFGSPWTLAATSSALSLLILTAIQTYFAIYNSYH